MGRDISSFDPSYPGSGASVIRGSPMDRYSAMPNDPRLEDSDDEAIEHLEPTSASSPLETSPGSPFGRQVMSPAQSMHQRLPADLPSLPGPPPHDPLPDVPVHDPRMPPLSRPRPLFSRPGAVESSHESS